MADRPENYRDESSLGDEIDLEATLRGLAPCGPSSDLDNRMSRLLAGAERAEGSKSSQGTGRFGRHHLWWAAACLCFSVVSYGFGRLGGASGDEAPPDFPRGSAPVSASSAPVRIVYHVAEREAFDLTASDEFRAPSSPWVENISIIEGESP
ncbi:MAG: hypothetical protein AAF517_07255 [Planctomycetota bacterium]